MPPRGAASLPWNLVGAISVIFQRILQRHFRRRRFRLFRRQRDAVGDDDRSRRHRREDGGRHHRSNRLLRLLLEALQKGLQLKPGIFNSSHLATVHWSFGP